jgi:hypothetical protein
VSDTHDRRNTSSNIKDAYKAIFNISLDSGPKLRQSFA